MQRFLGWTTVAFLLLGIGVSQVGAQAVTFDFEDGTDQGFGTGFGANDATANFNIVNIGGSKRMEVPLGGFQVAGRPSATGDPGFAALDAAVNNPSVYTLSY